MQKQGIRERGGGGGVAGPSMRPTESRSLKERPGEKQPFLPASLCTVLDWKRVGRRGNLEGTGVLREEEGHRLAYRQARGECLGSCVRRPWTDPVKQEHLSQGKSTVQEALRVTLPKIYPKTLLPFDRVVPEALPSQVDPRVPVTRSRTNYNVVLALAF